MTTNSPSSTPQPTAPPADTIRHSRRLLVRQISALKARARLERLVEGETRAAEICDREVAAHVATIRQLDALHAAETDPALKEAIVKLSRFLPGGMLHRGDPWLHLEPEVKRVVDALLSLVPSLSPSPTGDAR